MLLNLYSVRDRQTDQYGNPMFLINHGHAIRGFTDEINKAASDNPNALANHPDDYDLYHLGTYDTDTGTLTPQNPEMIAIGKNCKR